MEKYSTGIRDAVLSQDDLRTLVKNGKLLIYSGSQPTDADSAVSGTLLCQIAANATYAWTAETLAQGKVTCTWTTGADSVTSITASTVEILGATVPIGPATANTTLAAFTDAVALQINKYNPLGIKASSGGSNGIVTLTAPYGVGAVTWAVVTTIPANGGDLAKTDTAFGTLTTGVPPASGLQYDLAASGAIAQSGTWAGTVTTAGSAGWFRIVGSVTDGGGASLVLPRVDGTITSTGGGGDITLTSTALALNAPITLTGVSLQFEATGK